MLQNYHKLHHDQTLVKQFGRVSCFIGMVIEVKGLKASIGEYCEIINSKKNKRLLAEVVGFRSDNLLLMPFDKGRGISMGDLVENTKHRAQIAISSDIIGHTVDPFCKPLDGTFFSNSEELLELYPNPGNPLSKDLVREQIITGVKAIDNFTPIGKGQRIGLFAGSGVGKTTLISMLTNNLSTDIKIIALIGERGREVLEFVELLKQHDKSNSYIVVAAAADQPPLTRAHAIYTATAIAEYYCSKGKDVLLVVDSITRFAMAQREVGLAIGEPPTTKGYTPSVFSQIPLLLERVGNYKNKGSITGIYTVLVEGNDFDEPVADHMRSILDGHIVLSRDLAEQGVYPPIDIVKSKSRLADKISLQSRIAQNIKIIKQYTKYRTIQDLVELGVYKKGDSPENDKILAIKESVDQFVSQPSNNSCTTEQLENELSMIMRVL